MNGTFDIPEISYFEQKNRYSGSIDKIFRFKIIPGDRLVCKVWYGINAIDSIKETDIVAQSDYDMSQGGIDAMVEWLEAQHNIFAEKNS